MKELWRVSTLNSGYEVSSLGNVRSVDRSVRFAASRRTSEYVRKFTGRPVAPFISKATGYLQVRLGKSGRQNVHRLIAMEFCDGFAADLTVNHKNGIRTDNRAANLEWVTMSENLQHSFRVLGRVTHTKGKFSGEHPTSKSVVATCLLTGREKVYEAAMDAVREGFDSSSISRCCSGKCRSHKGFKWRFVEHWEQAA